MEPEIQIQEASVRYKFLVNYGEYGCVLYAFSLKNNEFYDSSLIFVDNEDLNESVSYEEKSEISSKIFAKINISPIND
jgi:hypothetical protein